MLPLTTNDDDLMMTGGDLMMTGGDLMVTIH